MRRSLVQATFVQGLVLSNLAAALRATRQCKGAEVSVRFDEFDRISRIECGVQPASTKKPWWRVW
jgi:hypothetical protein